MRQRATQGNHCVTSTGFTVQMLNTHYASVLQDLSDKIPYRKLAASCIIDHLSTWRVFNVLDHPKHTAVGLDYLLAWFLRQGSVFFAKPLAALFNMSLSL